MEPTPIEPEGMFDGLRWSFIIRGALLDIVLTVVASIPLMLIFAGADAMSGTEEAANEAFEKAAASPGFVVSSYVVGFLITIYATFWASRRAGVHFLRHGGWTAVVSAALGSLMLLAPGNAEAGSTAGWFEIVSLFLMIPAGLLGGWLAAQLSDREVS